MKRNHPPVWLCAVLLVLALLWNMLGAPLTREQFARLSTPLWQARVLLPSRMARVLALWPVTVPVPQPQTLAEDAENTHLLPNIANDEKQEMLHVYLSQENRMTAMSLDGYVCGVMAAEMPAAYHIEALKAQAVAARTRVLWQRNAGGCALHPGADICTDSSHCQGYATLSECKQRWGNEYTTYRDRILEAERATANEILTYEGQPITVMYHAISGGRTENAAAVFSQQLPYLVSVNSESENEARGLTTDTTLTFQQIADALNASHSLHLTAENVRRTLSVGGYTDTGRVQSMLVDGKTIPATAFRSALSLRSTWFSLSMDEDTVTFHQRGYGHGVGMSQAGANGMAADGANYAQILLHYYPGVTLEKAPDADSLSLDSAS